MMMNKEKEKDLSKDKDKRRSFGNSATNLTKLEKSESSSSSSNIKVVCRFRPPKSGEVIANSDSCQVDLSNSSVEIIGDHFDKRYFTFDKLYSHESQQSEIFESVVEVVDSIMTGFNGTVLAYGQTSAGKSWTMEGPSIWDTASQGIIPRSIDRVFDNIAKADMSISFEVSVSYYEIYCEKLRDLLNPHQDNMKMRETKNNGFVIQEVTESFCTDKESILRVLEMGKTNRASAPTLMNAESSRSHSILSINVKQKNEASGRIKNGRLFLVDLAGSEKVNKTGATGMRLEEAKNINSSLTTLGMVINALCDGSSHIPYRDSKLTRLLMESLGGNSRTTLIICCAPEQRHLPETLSTLRFGERAKKIQNHAKVNEELSIEDYKIMLQAAKKEIMTLRATIKLLENKDSIDAEVAVINSSESTEIDPGHAIDIHSVSPIFDIDDMSKDHFQTSSENAPSAAIAELSGLLKLKEEEAHNYQSKIAMLHDEVERNEAEIHTEKEMRLHLAAETEALKNTVTYLEGELLKANMAIKRRASVASSSTSPTTKEGGIETFFDDVSNDSAPNTPIGGSTGERNLGNSSTVSTKLFPEVNSVTIEQPKTPLISNDDSLVESTIVSKNEVENNRQDFSMGELEADTLKLKATLENEIIALNQKMTVSDIEIKTAQESASIYAEKYILMRNDYNSHVQRLMMKLTQEQQLRTHVEDRLDDALERLSRANSNTNKSFFSSIFSGHKSAPEDEKAMSAREWNMSKALEIFQSRAISLADELEATKEAQAIVLDTKESVMRSLVKQNSILTTEKDGLQRRVDDLSATVDQLTGLLRSVQSRKMTPIRHNSIHSNTNMIRGGGGGLKQDEKDTQDENKE